MISQESAETMALSVLAWIVGEDEILTVFLGATGTSETDLRMRAGDPDFLASVLDFLLMDDAWVVACARSLGQSPETMLQIRAALPGGQLPHWT